MPSKEFIRRAPYKTANIDELPEIFKQYEIDIGNGSLKFIVDRDGIVIRRCGRAVNTESMVDEMNERAAMGLMIQGTAADPNMNCDIYSPYVDPERYQK